MKKLATLFTDSYNEFRYTRTVTIAAMLGAITLVLGYFTLTLGDNLKIGFSSISSQLVYCLFGPVVGGFFGGAMDLLKYLVKPTGPFFPGFTLNAALAGVLYGMMLYKKKVSFIRILTAEFVVSMICNVLITTFFLDLLYGNGFFVLLPIRFLKNIIMWPINTFLFYSIAKTLELSRIFQRHIVS